MEADYSNPDASKSLPAIRQLLFEGKNREAQELMYSSFVPKKKENKSISVSYTHLAEHDIEGERYRHIEHLTNGYTAPEDACNSYRLVLQQLKAFEEA